MRCIRPLPPLNLSRPGTTRLQSLGKMRSMVWVVASLVLVFGSVDAVKAQDPQFSQFYAAPLYLNPAFAGSTNQARAGINYRNQWPAIDANFTTMSFFADYFIEDKN